MKVKVFKTIIRWLLSVACIGIAFLLLGFHRENPGFHSVSAPEMIFAMGMLIAAGLFTAPETAAPIAEYIGECWGNLFFPSARFHKPPLSYILADHYNNQERYAEAIIEYQKILRFYPKERKANVELITLCKKIGEAKLAEKYERRFRKRFQSRGRARKTRKNQSWF